jgi:type IV pilus assembly protein PilV
MKQHRHVRARRQSGFGIMEVLVALVVLSLGLLSIAGLQIISIRSVHGSFVRGQAMLSAYAIADRMRANRFAVRDLDGTAIGFYNSADGATYQAPNDNNCTEDAGAATACTVAEMAAHDLFEWTQSLAAGPTGLPNGQGTVCIDATSNDGTPAAPACDGAGNTYAIKIWWTDIEQAGATTKRYVMRFQL